MKAILVKYKGPTNTKCSRFIASAEGVKSVSIPYYYALSADGNAEQAAYSLCMKYGWKATLAGGSLPNGDRCFVMVNN